MAKPIKFDESGDSEDLQALFDSIAAGAPEPTPAVMDAPGSNGDASGDSEDLQALFDSVAAGSPEAMPAAVAGPSSNGDASGDSDDLQALFDSVVAQQAAPEAVEGGDMYTRLGKMTRALHDSLRELGYDKILQDTARAMPDTRERLSYIGQMTEQAASRVLNATDIAKPLQESLQSQAQALGSRWDQVFANQLSVDQFKALAAETQAFLREVPVLSRATNEQLTEIMMAQDFQDLTGQVIKKVADMAQTMETQLLQLLLDALPEDKRPASSDGLVNGPVISAEGRSDVVTSQSQVDDLLDSLGF